MHASTSLVLFSSLRGVWVQREAGPGKGTYVKDDVVFSTRIGRKNFQSNEDAVRKIATIQVIYVGLEAYCRSDTISRRYNHSAQDLQQSVCKSET